MLRVSAYAVVMDGEGARMLLAHWQAGGRGGWTLPGGGLDPMEDPADAVVREVREETGYDVVVDELLGVDSLAVPGSRRLEPAVEDMHALRIVYRAHVVGGDLAHEVDGSTDETAWVPLADLDALDRVGLVDVGRRLAGLPDPTTPHLPDSRPDGSGAEDARRAAAGS